MKLFQILQTNLARLGVGSNLPPINGKLALSYLFFISNNVFYCVFFIHGANNFKEYTDSLYNSTGTILYTIIFTIVVLTAPKIFTLIEFAELFFDESESMPNSFFKTVFYGNKIKFKFFFLKKKKTN